MSRQSEDIFLVMFVGQLEYVHLPEAHDVFIKYKFVHGSDFVVTTGIQEAITQTATRVGWDALSPLHLNFPLEITLKASNPFGWPKLMLCAYGRDFFGREVLRGYGSVHMPAAAGRHSIRIPLFKPQPSTTLGSISGWLLGRSPEFIDPAIVTRSSGREVVRTSSSGFVCVDISVVSKGLTQLGYACSSIESRPVSTASYNLPFGLINSVVMPKRNSVLLNPSSQSTRPKSLLRSSNAVLIDGDDDEDHQTSDEKTILPNADENEGGSHSRSVISRTAASIAATAEPRRKSSTIPEGTAEESDDEKSETSDDDEEDTNSNSSVSKPSAAPQPTPRRRSSAGGNNGTAATVEAFDQINDANESSSSTAVAPLERNSTDSRDKSGDRIRDERTDYGSGSSRRSSYQQQHELHTVQIDTHEGDRSTRFDNNH